MAKVLDNVILHGISGKIGDMVLVRRMHNGDYVVGKAPKVRKGREATLAQKDHQERFRQAVLYAKGAKDNPEYKALGKSRGMSSFNVATADFFHAPEILSVDVSAYSGAHNQAIAITTVDDVKVASVGVVLAQDDDTVIEKGQATPSLKDPRVWTYTTTVNAPSPSVKVLIDVADLTGQVASAAAHT
jgi:hypothetical protein